MVEISSVYIVQCEQLHCDRYDIFDGGQHGHGDREVVWNRAEHARAHNLFKYEGDTLSCIDPVSQKHRVRIFPIAISVLLQTRELKVRA